MNYDDNIGKNIREVRLEKKLSQEELARKCGFSNTTLSAYEHSRKIPNLSTIAKIAKELEVTIERLYYERFSYGYNALMEGDSNGPNGVFLYIHKYYPQIKRLISSLNEFDERKTTYDDPDNYLKILLASVAKEINDEIDKEKKKV